MDAQERKLGNPVFIQVECTAGDLFHYSFQISPDERLTEIRGTPFFNEAWQDAEVELVHDTLIYYFPMRYNMYVNQMQFIYREDTFSIGNPLMVDHVQLGGHRFVYLPFHLGEQFNMAWFEVMTEGWPRLLVRHESRLDAGSVPVTPYHCQNDYSRFVKRSVSYYMTAEMDEPVEIPLSRKKFDSLDILDGYRDSIRELRINPRRQGDLVELFKLLGQPKSSLKI